MVKGKDESKNSVVKAWMPKKATSAIAGVAGDGRGSTLVWKVFVHRTFPRPLCSLSVLIQSRCQYLPSLKRKFKLTHERQVG